MADSRRIPSTILCLVLVAAATTALTEEEPEYPHGEFEDDCSLCHDSDSWTPVRIAPEFEHARGGFPLLAAHARTDCRSCHGNLDFGLADPSCVSCHMDIHRSEMGLDCQRCHTSRSFIDRSAMTRAHALTRFPIRGVHATLDCEECHAPGGGGSMQFVGTPAECQACHLEEYLATEEPDHASLGFPTDCEQCHAPVAWDRTRGRIDHEQFAGLPCETCHMNAYLSTDDPDHQAIGFPTDCDTCHSPTGWDRVQDGFDHDGLYFPIFSGNHRGRWTDCSDCHIGGNYSGFSCLQCHAHDDEGDLAEDHDEVTGFQYESEACYSCHRRGEE